MTHNLEQWQSFRHKTEKYGVHIVEVFDKTVKFETQGGQVLTKTIDAFLREFKPK